MKNLSVQFNSNWGEHFSSVSTQGVNENYFDKLELLVEIVDETLKQAVAGLKKEDQLSSISSGLIHNLNHYRQQLVDLKNLLKGPKPMLWPEIKAEADLLISDVYKNISLL
jgi:DNA primase large subunit